MRIQETDTRPAIQGGGWSQQSRVRDLEAGETLPAGAVAVDDKTPISDWQEAANSSNPLYPGKKAAIISAPSSPSVSEVPA